MNAAESKEQALMAILWLLGGFISLLKHFLNSFIIVLENIKIEIAWKIRSRDLRW